MLSRVRMDYCSRPGFSRPAPPGEIRDPLREGWVRRCTGPVRGVTVISEDDTGQGLTGSMYVRCLSSENLPCICTWGCRFTATSHLPVA
jgi:hypothetical protein